MSYVMQPRPVVNASILESSMVRIVPCEVPKQIICLLWYLSFQD